MGRRARRGGGMGRRRGAGGLFKSGGASGRGQCCRGRRAPPSLRPARAPFFRCRRLRSWCRDARFRADAAPVPAAAGLRAAGAGPRRRLLRGRWRTERGSGRGRGGRPPRLRGRPGTTATAAAQARVHPARGQLRPPGQGLLLQQRVPLQPVGRQLPLPAHGPLPEVGQVSRWRAPLPSRPRRPSERARPRLRGGGRLAPPAAAVA